MFKNRAISVQVVKKTPDTSIAQPKTTLDPYELNELIKDQTRHIAVLVGIAYTGRIFLTTTRDLVLILATKKLQ